ncbi:unnamed protein product, partial [Amoebophrya sp. A25]
EGEPDGDVHYLDLAEAYGFCRTTAITGADANTADLNPPDGVTLLDVLRFFSVGGPAEQQQGEKYYAFSSVHRRLLHELWNAGYRLTDMSLRSQDVDEEGPWMVPVSG